MDKIRAMTGILFGMTLITLLMLVGMTMLQSFFIDETGKVLISYPIDVFVKGTAVTSAAYLGIDLAGVIKETSAMEVGSKAPVERFPQYLIVTVCWMITASIMTAMYTKSHGADIFDTTAIWGITFGIIAFFVGMLKGNNYAANVFIQRFYTKGTSPVKADVNVVSGGDAVAKVATVEEDVMLKTTSDGVNASAATTRQD